MAIRWSVPVVVAALGACDDGVGETVDALVVDAPPAPDAGRCPGGFVPPGLAVVGDDVVGDGSYVFGSGRFVSNDGQRHHLFVAADAAVITPPQTVEPATIDSPAHARIWYRVDPSTFTPEIMFATTAGGLTVSALCDERVAGSLAGVTLNEYTSNAAGFEFPADGCSFTLDSLTFDLMLAPCP